MITLIRRELYRLKYWAAIQGLIDAHYYEEFIERCGK